MFDRSRSGCVVCLAAGFLIPAAAAEPSKPQPACSQPADDYTVACFYFPDYHVDSRNDAIHGPDWTEWELVKKARPRFPGHHQPNVPAWGYEDESEPSAMARKIDAAADHGIDVFLFDWYYYDNGPYLQRALEQGFMKAPNCEKLKFALMWANHDLVDIHPAKPRLRPLREKGTVTPATFDRMTDYIIATYFKHPSCWKVDGKPFFSIYQLKTLVESFGNIEATVDALQRFRAKTRAAGFPGLHLNGITWGIPILPGETAGNDRREMAQRLGLDSVTSYVWIHHVKLDKFPQTDYAEVREKSIAYWHEAAAKFPMPYYPNVTMGWDASPRTIQTEKFANYGYPYMAMMSGNTPAAFRKALLEARTFLDSRPRDQRVVTLNAWNEWTEGSYLEPDTVHGMAYLEAIRDVFSPSK